MAANPEITTLSKIKAHKTAWNFNARILHSWRNLPIFGGESLDMILADAEGTLIHASIRKQQIPKFVKVIKSGEWRTFEHCTVSKAIGKYRATAHTYKITFMHNSIIKSCPSVNNDWLFDFQNFEDISNNQGLNENYLIDVIGQVVNVGEITIHKVKQKDTKRLEIELRNTTDERLTCTLWDGYVDTMWNAFENKGDEKVICLIRLAKINTFNGQRSIANAYDMSLLEINPNYPEVDYFVANLPNDDVTLTLLPTEPKESKVMRKKEYFDSFPRKTISELGEATEVGKCKIMCAINTIDTEFPWYYFQCLKCNKTADLIPKKENEIVKKGKKPTFHCRRCNEDTQKVVPRYRLVVGVMDTTGDTKCMLFDNNAFEIIGKSANDLLEGNWREIQDPTNIPMPLRALVGKTFQLLVSIENANINEENDTYKVSYVWLGDEANNVDSVEDSDIQVSCATNSSSIEKGQLPSTNISEMDDSLEIASTTPSSKRSTSDGTDDSYEQSSSSKKPCVNSIKGVIDEKEVVEHEKKEITDDTENEVMEVQKNKGIAGGN